jgi:heat shock protein 5
MAVDNHFLGQLLLEGVQRARGGVPQIEVTLSVDSNGLLHVSARDLVTRARGDMTIKLNDVRLSPMARAEAIRRAEAMKEEDQRVKQSAVARNSLDSYLLKVRSLIAHGELSVSHESQETIRVLVGQGLDWSESHRTESADVIERKHREIERTIVGLVDRVEL